MKDLYINESILDDEEDIISGAESAAEVKAAAGWLMDHGIENNYIIQRIFSRGIECVTNSGSRNPFYEDGKWVLSNSSDSNKLTLTKKDKEIPYFVRLKSIDNLIILNSPIKNLPDLSDVEVKVLSIRNCPNLTSLEGCPKTVSSFSVSGCPNIKSLNGCPKKAQELFKFINNGINVDAKDIRKVCMVDKKNIIY